MKSNDSRDFFAFVSYSHRDAKWARWLARSLESYRLPAELAKRSNLPSRKLGLVFRDDDESRASQGLLDDVKRAIQSSKNLIVICSRASAASEWVAREVEYCHQTKGRDRVFYLVVDGVPAASLMADADPNLECLPRPLIEYASKEGVANLPLAADPRRSGKQAALLKLIAGMNALEFDELYRRDLRRRVSIALTAASAAFVLAVGATVLLMQGARARGERDAQTALALVRQSERATQNDEAAEGLKLALDAIKLDQDGNASTQRILAEDMARFAINGLREVARVGLDSTPVGFAVSPSGREFLLCFGDRTLRFYDGNSLVESKRVTVKGEVTLCGYSADASKAYVALKQGSIVLVDTGSFAQSTIESPEDRTLVAASFLGGNESIVAAELAGKLFVYRGNEGVQRQLHDHGFMARVAALEPTADGRFVVSITTAGSSAVVEVASGKAIEFSRSAGAFYLDVHPSEPRFLVGFSDGVVEERVVAQAAVQQGWQLAGGLTQVSYSSDGSAIRLASEQSGPVQLNTASYNQEWIRNPGQKATLNMAAANGSAVAILQNGVGIVADARAKDLHSTIQLKGEPTFTRFLINEDTLVTVSSRGVMQSWNLRWPKQQ
ncbi:MAG TPA: toll/interleukin-1 receptor domain-containing protein, partial [Steroidobacteraceae bacterium]|nr:toll/interleukin-1 receptor domain-containing protein [Steroidobacteraceae bacterium]